MRNVAVERKRAKGRRRCAGIASRHAFALAALALALLGPADAAAWYRDPQILALEALRAGSARPLSVRFDRGFPRTVETDVAIIGPASPGAAARAFLASYGELYRQTDPLALPIVGTRDSGDGVLAVVFGQRFAGLRVFGARLVVGVRTDPLDPDVHRVLFTAGALLPPLDLDPLPSTPPSVAEDTARVVLGRFGAPLLAATEAVVFDPRLFDGAADPRLAWAVTLGGGEPVQVLVDAETSQLLFEHGLLPSDAGLSGLDLDLRDAAGFALAPCSESGALQLGDESGLTPAGAGNVANALLWAHARETYLDYHELLGRHSWDGADVGLVVFSHLGGFPNAYFDGKCDQLLFTDAFVSLDVMGHEFGHGVIESSPSALIYQGMSGALNESYADLLGALVVDPDDWLLSEDRLDGQGAVRSIADPPGVHCGPPSALVACGQPDRVPDYLVTKADYGGVHFNSGIPNKAHYLMAQGGTFRSVPVAGMGRAKTLRLAYFVLRFLTPSATFTDARNLSVAAAQVWAALGFWGFTAADVCTVRNAFAAVGIGAADLACDGQEDGGADGDGDFILDLVDNCPFFANPTQGDWNGDQTGDACDPDPDSDGVPVGLDNCPDTFNPGVQYDQDGDGLGDACDDDRDGDGVIDWPGDNCPFEPNPGQQDGDGDGFGNACDPDHDGDGIYGDDDNCPRDANPAQTDTDGDGLGDACDGCPAVADDTLSGTWKWTPDGPMPVQPDSDGDGIPDACDPLGFATGGLTFAGVPVSPIFPLMPDGVTRGGVARGGGGELLSLPIAGCGPGDPEGPAFDRAVEIVLTGLAPEVDVELVDRLERRVARARAGGGPNERGLRFVPDCTETYTLELRVGAGFPGRNAFDLVSRVVSGAGPNPWASTPALGLPAPPPLPDEDGDRLPDGIDTCPFAFAPENADRDGDGRGDACDNCPFAPNASQLDRGGVGAGSPADGIGDACQCGDVNGDGRVSLADSVAMTRALLLPPTATMTAPQRCDVGASAGCTIADALIVRRALLDPPSATILPRCAPAQP